MNQKARQFLIDLLETPSPSGREEPVQEVVRSYAGQFADSVTTDVHGNVIAAVNVEAGERPDGCKVLFAGHCDQIGLLVSHIDGKGFLWVQPLGGWDPQQLIGQRMTVWAKDGPVPAVIARKPIHLLNAEERRRAVKMENLWLDIGAADGEDAREVVRVGDPVTLELGFRELRNGLANAPKMDNTTGLWVVVEALRRVVRESPGAAVYAVSTVCEEIGLRGARTSTHGVAPDVGIAVDVTHATDCPTISKRQEGNLKLGGGPVIVRGPNMNPKVSDRLESVAEAAELPFQLAALGRAAPNDANPIQLTRSGVATGLVSIPNRYMHSAVETIAMDDIDHAADLLAGFAASLGPGDSFVPGI